MAEIPKPIRVNLIRLALSFVVTAFITPFITYDTGVRCITAPCEAAADRGSLVEFLAKSNDFNAYIVDYWLFLTVFIGLFVLIKVLDKWIKS